MRKPVISLFAVTIVVSMLFLTGCDSIDENLVGRWTWDFDSQFVTTFNEDGTGSHTISWGYGYTFTWTTRGDNLLWDYPNHPGMQTPYRIQNDRLYLTMVDGTVFVYIRQ